MGAPYPCPCCGHLVFEEPPGSYATCPVCFFEDDGLRLEFATSFDGGPGQVTLLQAQRNYLQHGVSNVHELRNAHGAHRVSPRGAEVLRDPAWRPISLEEDRFEDWNVPAPRSAPAHADLYYWRPTYWRRAGTKAQ